MGSEMCIRDRLYVGSNIGNEKDIIPHDVHEETFKNIEIVDDAAVKPESSSIVLDDDHDDDVERVEQERTALVSETNLRSINEFHDILEDCGDMIVLNPDESDDGGFSEDISDTVDMLENEPEKTKEDDGDMDMPKMASRSPAAVWRLAVKVPGGARCNLCDKTYKCMKGNTSNIMGHITKAHRDQAEVQILIKEQIAKKEKLKRSKKMQEDDNRKEITQLSYQQILELSLAS